MPPFLHSLLVAIAILLTYTEPLLLLAIWGRKFYKPYSGGPLWRDLALWLSLAGSSIAVTLFWGTMLEAYHFHVGHHFQFAHYGRIGIGFAVFALIAAIFSFGNARKWAILCAVIVPFSWLATGTLQ